MRQSWGLLGGLGKVLGAPRGVLVPTETVFGPTLAPKYLHKGSHTTHHEKNIKKRDPETRVGGTGTTLWRPRKTANFEKSIAKVLQNTEENANPANMA